MDFCRAAHDEQCKFFNNGGPVIPVRFYEAAADAPTLGLTNIIYPGINDPQYWPDWTIGTPTTPRVNFTGARAPLGLTYNHICGTKEQFAQGATYDPSAPPIPIGSQGLPLCCSPPPRVGGGAGVGGRGTYSVISRPPVTTWSSQVYNNTTIASGVPFGAQPAGSPLMCHIVGHYSPAAPAGWTRVRTWVDNTGTVFGASYFKIASAPLETCGPFATGTDVFSALAFECNGSALHDSSAVLTPTSTGVAPPAVNTLTANTLVVTWNVRTGGMSAPTFQPNPFTIAHGFYSNLGVQSDNWGGAIIVNTGTPYAPAATTWFVAAPLAVFSDSFV